MEGHLRCVVKVKKYRILIKLKFIGRLYELRKLRSGIEVWTDGGVDLLYLYTSTLPHIHTRILQSDSVLFRFCRYGACNVGVY